MESEKSTQAPIAPPLPTDKLLNKNNVIVDQSGYKSPSLDLNLVDSNLYIGCVEAANNVDNLKKLNITHILTVENYPLDDKVVENFTYKFVQLYDLPSMNILDILEDCIEFIDDGVKNGNVLVHCLVGMSRSASIVLGYLMWKKKLSLIDCLEHVRKNRYVRPNMGFHKQLEVFEVMNFKIVKDSMLYKSYKLENVADQIKRGARFDEIYDSSQLKDNDEMLDCYKCKKCRTKLFTINAIIPHIKSNNNQDDEKNWKSRLANFSDLATNSNNVESICREQLFIEPLKWFADSLSDVNGKLICFNQKCGSKLGTFDWCGSKCTCGNWVVPAIHIHSSKVDLCRSIFNK